MSRPKPNTLDPPGDESSQPTTNIKAQSDSTKLRIVGTPSVYIRITVARGILTFEGQNQENTLISLNLSAFFGSTSCTIMPTVTPF